VARKYLTEGVTLRSRCPDVGSPNQWHAGDALCPLVFDSARGSYSM
jgi:hypothetical protein